MALYTEESLDQLRSKIDLVDLLSSHLDLKRAGSAHVALCPFHEEKTPSFNIQAGGEHYHCFGCGAHGDAIAFLMGYLKMGFVEAVEHLAERYGVSLEKEEEGKKSGPDRVQLKGSLELACRFYHTCLLHTQEGHIALQYLYERGISLDYIRFFRLGWAPSGKEAWATFAKKEGIQKGVLQAAGLITERGRDFFADRITIPITDQSGSVIAFSARKIREETFGGKYINTAETSLFKKSHTLFGLSYSRQRIVKEGRVLIVEGQLDALRLIHEGGDFVVAAQGTAFGEGHVDLLAKLGVVKAYLAMDGDKAGKSAAIKIGHLLQRRGIGVYVVPLPGLDDPDSFVQREGISPFLELMEQALDYLTFLVKIKGSETDLADPAQKTRLVTSIVEQVRSWQEPVLVHESLKKLSKLLMVPESTIQLGAIPPSPLIKRFGSVDKQGVDGDQILENDLLRFLLLGQDPRLFAIAKLNLSVDMLCHSLSRIIFGELVRLEGKWDLLAIGRLLETEKEQKLLSQILERKINLKRAEAGLIEVIEHLLNRRWMEARDQIKIEMERGDKSEADLFELAKKFGELSKNVPKVVLP